jgi:sugar lactone lactonase YvrE
MIAPVSRRRRRTGVLAVVVSACFGWSTTLVRADDFQPTAQESIVPADALLERVWAEGSFTEGPAPAQDGTILFSDIGNRILRFDPRNKQTTVYREESGKANGLMFDRHGRLLACEGAGGGNRRVSITERDGTVKTLADRYQGRRFNSHNDLAIDLRGNVYFTDPRYGGNEERELDFEGVFVINAQGEVSLATRDVQKPNGIVVSRDGNTVYVADNHSDPQGNHQLVAFHVADQGLTDKKVLFDFGPDRRGIDGMTMDQQGNIYATAGTVELAGIYVFDPQGKPLAFLRTPGDPTNCVFGLGEEANTLYITAAVPDGPGRFGLYRVSLKIPGFHMFPQ